MRRATTENDFEMEYKSHFDSGRMDVTPTDEQIPCKGHTHIGVAVLFGTCRKHAPGPTPKHFCHCAVLREGRQVLLPLLEVFLFAEHLIPPNGCLGGSICALVAPLSRWLV